jgi:hypothetical protein
MDRDVMRLRSRSKEGLGAGTDEAKGHCGVDALHDGIGPVQLGKGAVNLCAEVSQPCHPRVSLLHQPNRFLFYAILYSLPDDAADMQSVLDIDRLYFSDLSYSRSHNFTVRQKISIGKAK